MAVIVASGIAPRNTPRIIVALMFSSNISLVRDALYGMTKVI